MKKLVLFIFIIINLYAGLNEDFLDGVNLNTMQNYEASNTKLNKILPELDIQRNKKELSMVYYLKGSNDFNLKNFTNAIDNFSKAIKYSNYKDVKESFVFNLYSFLGFAYEKDTQMDNAKKSLNTAISLYEKLKPKEQNEMYLAKIYLSFGDIYSYELDYTSANKYYKLAYNIYKKSPDINSGFLDDLDKRINAIENRK